MKRVLIADDASFMRQMIRDIIEPEGYEVVGEASDGMEVVEKFRKLRPDLVMMDIVMPKRSGIDAVRAIRSEDSGATIVMCSALGQETLVMEAIQAGAFQVTGDWQVLPKLFGMLDDFEMMFDVLTPGKTAS